MPDPTEVDRQYKRIRRAAIACYGSFALGGVIIIASPSVFVVYSALHIATTLLGTLVCLGGMFYAVTTPCPACGKWRFRRGQLWSWRVCTRCGDRHPDAV